MSKSASGFTGKPSKSVNPKTISPFTTDRSTSNFATAYSNGLIPCSLVHGSVKHKLQWSTHVDQLPFDPLIEILSEGLNETKHPYTFIARMGFKQLMELPDAREKTVPLLPRIIPHIRTAVASKDDKIFVAALDAINQLSRAVGPDFNPHLKILLQPLAKHYNLDLKNRDVVMDTLSELEQNGNAETITIIKTKIPTYS